MANPFLVLGGIAISVAAATFGVLQVPGWVASAQDATATNDLSNIRLAQAAAVSSAGEYFDTLAELDALDAGVKLSWSNGVAPVGLKSDDDAWCAIVKSASGTFFAASSEKTGYAHGAEATSAATAAGCPNTLAPRDAIVWSLRCDVDTPVQIAARGLNGTLEWSDGETQAPSNGSPPAAKNLLAGKDYELAFKGTATELTTHTMGAASKACYRSLDEFPATAKTTSMAMAFNGMSNLTSVPEEIPPGITAMAQTFRDAKVFNGDISKWDTSEVVDMNWMFRGASAFNQPLNGWDVSGVENFTHMFESATAFNQPLNRWDVAEATDFSYMFGSASAFDQPLNDWKTLSALNMSFMFSGASAFDQPLSDWKTDNVQRMASMFANTNTNPGISGWNTGNVTTMQRMFGSSTFNEDISNWNVSKVEDFSYMFYRAEVFNQPISKWSTVSAESMDSMFDRAEAFAQDLSMWKVDKVQTARSFARFPSHFRPAFLPGTAM